MRGFVLAPLLAALACHSTATPASAPVRAEPSPTRVTLEHESTGLALSCRHPAELWLAVHERTKVLGAYVSQCAKPDDDSKPYWALLDESVPVSCEEIEYLRSAILAYYGRAVPFERWRRYLTGQPWYRPPVSRSTLSPEATSNLDWLEHRTCQETSNANARDRALVEQWFAGKEAGQPELPARLFVDGQPVSREELMAFLSHAPFRFDERTPISYTLLMTTDRTVTGADVRTLSIFTSHPGIGCIDLTGTDCEGFEHLQLAFDASDHLVALHATASD